MGIAERMTFLRERRGLSVDETAELFGVNSMTVLRWESGRCRPKAHNVKAAAEYYGVSAEWILTGVQGVNGQALPVQSGGVEDRFFVLYTDLPDEVRGKFAAYFNREFGEVARRGGDLGGQASRSA